VGALRMTTWGARDDRVEALRMTGWGSQDDRVGALRMTESGHSGLQGQGAHPRSGLRRVMRELTA